MWLGGKRVLYEPIDVYPTEETPAAIRRNATFSASFTKTKALLSRELDQLGAKRIVVQLDVKRTSIRNDGGLRNDRPVLSPRVVLSFDSKYGPQCFPCDTFTHWHDNVRAIALSLEALRKVDRYGVTKRAQQYRGFQALPAPAPSPADGYAHEETAWEKIVEHSSASVSFEIATPELTARAYREAQANTHPDAGGDPEEFKWVQAAGEKLGVA